MDPALQQQLQAANAQYPPPPSAGDEVRHDFAQSTAAAALQSDHQTQQLMMQPPPQHSYNPPAATPRKRKPAIPGSRGVANLTPDQLTKKRANDREAQRAIRERTKNTIAQLEARIHELESQQPYQEMQHAIMERDRALAECEELKRRLEAVAGIVGHQNLGQMGLNQLAALTAQQAPLPTVTDQAVMLPPKTDVNAMVEEQPNLHPDLRAHHEGDGSQPATPG